MAQLVVQFPGQALPFLFLGREELAGQEAQPFLRFPQALLGSFAVRDIVDGGPALQEIAGLVGNDRGVQKHRENRPIFAS